MRQLASRRVVLAGLFSAKHPSPEPEMDALAARVRALGGTCVGQVLQRRGVSRASRPGGSKLLEAPLTAKTVLGSGKAGELAALCKSERADLVVFWNHLTPVQRESLEALTGVEVLDGAALGLGTSVG